MKTCFSYRRAFSLSSAIVFTLATSQALAQKRRLPVGGRLAVVVDEKLSVLRASPDLSGKLLRRIGRGRLVAVRGESRSGDGVLFYRVNLSRRTRGWIQREAVISASRSGDDEKLLRLIRASRDFDRIARARIFLDTFPQSPLRPAVLLIYGDAAEEAATKLSRDSVRRLDEREMTAGGALRFSYFLNYSGLDRYQRQGIRFGFDREQKSFHYNGASWQEIVRRFPRSSEAEEARYRLQALRHIQDRKQ